MLVHLKNTMYKILDWWEDRKGARYFRLDETYQSPNDGYTIITNHGFEIKIHCREIVYSCIYQSWWSRDKKISVYHVYSVCTDDTPQEIKDRLKNDLRINSFLHPWTSKESQKKQVIKTYVDLLMKY